MDSNGAVDLVQQAEDLLRRVKGYRAASQPLHVSSGNSSSSSSSSSNSDDKSVGHGRNELNVPASDDLSSSQTVQLSNLGDSVDKFRRRNLDHTSWLLPELGMLGDDDDDDVVDDELVERLLEEGGPAPSQVRYPGLYSRYNEITARLGNVRYLCVEIQHLNVYSAQYGVRKSYCQLQLQPPVGIIDPMSESGTAAPISSRRCVSLAPSIRHDEGKASISTVSPGNRQHTAKNDYFVGQLPLDEFVVWDVGMSNDVTHAWMSGVYDRDLSGDAGKVLRLELRSCVYPPASAAAGPRGKAPTPSSSGGRGGTGRAQEESDVNFVCFASVNIPLHGLLCTPTLDAYTTCDLLCDKNTQTQISSKTRSAMLTPSARLLAQKANAADKAHNPRGQPDVLGTLRLRLSLQETYPVQKVQQHQVPLRSTAHDRRVPTPNSLLVQGTDAHCLPAGSESPSMPATAPPSRPPHLRAQSQSQSQAPMSLSGHALAPPSHVLPASRRNSDALNRIMDDALTYVPHDQKQASGGEEATASTGPLQLRPLKPFVLPSQASLPDTPQHSQSEPSPTTSAKRRSPPTALSLSRGPSGGGFTGGMQPLASRSLSTGVVAAPVHRLGSWVPRAELLSIAQSGSWGGGSVSDGEPVETRPALPMREEARMISGGVGEEGDVAEAVFLVDDSFESTYSVRSNSPGAGTGLDAFASFDGGDSVSVFDALLMDQQRVAPEHELDDIIGDLNMTSPDPKAPVIEVLQADREAEAEEEELEEALTPNRYTAVPTRVEMVEPLEEPEPPQERHVEQLTPIEGRDSPTTTDFSHDVVSSPVVALQSSVLETDADAEVESEVEPEPVAAVAEASELGSDSESESEVEPEPVAAVAEASELGSDSGSESEVEPEPVAAVAEASELGSDSGSESGSASASVSEDGYSSDGFEKVKSVTIVVSAMKGNRDRGLEGGRPAAGTPPMELPPTPMLPHNTYVFDAADTAADALVQFSPQVASIADEEGKCDETDSGQVGHSDFDSQSYPSDQESDSDLERRENANDSVESGSSDGACSGTSMGMSDRTDGERQVTILVSALRDSDRTRDVEYDGSQGARTPPPDLPPSPMLPHSTYLHSPEDTEAGEVGSEAGEAAVSFAPSAVSIPETPSPGRRSSPSGVTGEEVNCEEVDTTIRGVTIIVPALKSSGSGAGDGSLSGSSSRAASPPLELPPSPMLLHDEVAHGDEVAAYAAALVRPGSVESEAAVSFAPIGSTDLNIDIEDAEIAAAIREVTIIAPVLKSSSTTGDCGLVGASTPPLELPPSPMLPHSETVSTSTIGEDLEASGVDTADANTSVSFDPVAVPIPDPLSPSAADAAEATDLFVTKEVTMVAPALKSAHAWEDRRDSDTPPPELPPTPMLPRKVVSLAECLSTDPDPVGVVKFSSQPVTIPAAVPSGSLREDKASDDVHVPEVPFVERGVVTRAQAGALAADMDITREQYNDNFAEQLTATNQASGDSTGITLCGDVSPNPSVSSSVSTLGGAWGFGVGGSGLVPVHVSLQEIDRELEKSFALIEGRAAARSHSKSQTGAGRGLRRSSESTTAGAPPAPGNEALRQWEGRHKRQFVEYETNRLAAKLTSKKY